MSKPRPVFDEMPMHIKEQIIWGLNGRDRLTCRYVSKTFKAISDSPKSRIRIPYVNILNLESMVLIQLPDTFHMFFSRGADCVVQKDARIRHVADGNYIREAVRCLESMARMANLRIEKLEMDGNTIDDDDEEGENQDGELWAQILSIFREGHVESVKFLKKCSFDIEKLMEMEVMKGVEHLDMGKIEMDRLQLDRMSNLSSLTASVKFMSAQDIKDVLELFLADKNKQQFVISCENVELEMENLERGKDLTYENKEIKRRVSIEFSEGMTRTLVVF